MGDEEANASGPVSKSKRIAKRLPTSHNDLSPRLCELAQSKTRPTTCQPDSSTSPNRSQGSIFRPGTSEAAIASYSRPASSPRLHGKSSYWSRLPVLASWQWQPSPERPLSQSARSARLYGSSRNSFASAAMAASSLSRVRAESLRERILQQPRIESVQENTELWE